LTSARGPGCALALGCFYSRRTAEERAGADGSAKHVCRGPPDPLLGEQAKSIRARNLKAWRRAKQIDQATRD
jgi:hypothetical protein